MEPYVVIESGGKQHVAKLGQELTLEKIEAEVGKSVDLSKVLMVVEGEKVSVGAPHVAGVSVAAEIVEHGRGKKVTIIKFKRRKKYRRKQGHRQSFTKVKITSIQGLKGA